MSDLKRVNGRAPSWGGIIIKIGEERYYGITGVGYGDKLEMIMGYGMGRHHAPTRRSAGKYSTDPGKLKMYKDSAEVLRSALAALAEDGRSYGTVEFEIVVQIVWPNGTPLNVEIHRVRLSEEATQHDEGPELLMEDLTYSCMSIVKNGKTLFDSSEGLP